MEVIDIVKSKLPEPLPSDEKLNDFIKEVEQSILNYCNIRHVPKQLAYTQANMMIDLLNREESRFQAGNEDEKRTVTSIKEGDVTVQFGKAGVPTSEQSMEFILFNYADQLKRFRRLRW